MIYVSGATHKGSVRPNNQDSIGCSGLPAAPADDNFSFEIRRENGEITAAVVADGVGGLPGGREASRFAVHRFLDQANQIAGVSDLESLLQELHEDTVLALDSIPGCDRGATTIAGIIYKDQQVICFNVGDSRIYRQAAGKLECVSTDHRMSAIGTVVGKTNVITNYLGGGDVMFKVKPAVVIFDRCESEVYLLCSDGITDSIPESELTLLMETRPLADLPARLIDGALNHQASDNISAVVISASA